MKTKDTSFEAYFDEFSAIAEVKPEQGMFALVPNPTRGMVEVRTGEGVDCNGRCRMVLHDMSGRELRRMDLTGSVTQVDIENLKSGIYFVTVVTRQGVATRKLVVE